MKEIYKNIPGYEDLYKISNLGNVKISCKKILIRNKYPYISKEKNMKLILNKNGYYQVTLTKDQKSKSFTVHQLVSITFLNHNPCGYKLVIDHINDNKLDNRVENLQIVTNRFNTCKTQGKYSSKYKGVYLEKRSNKYISRIRINGKQNILGYFKCEFKAHLEYQKFLNKI